jgi:ubiquitin carboxyl-terminal hydrolase 8
MLINSSTGSTTHPTHPSGGSISEPGASIRDRLQALGDSGMNVSTAKGQWSSRDSHGSSQHQKQTQRNHRNSISAAPSAPRSSDSSTMHPINGTHGTSTNSHTLIPASSFGPPSPLSSPPSSPGSSQFDVSSQLGQSSSSRNAFSSLFANSSKSPPPNSFDRDLVQFSQAFPSIDEFEELNALNLPSVPAIAPGANTNKANGQKTGGSSNGSDGGTGQSFPIPPVNLGQRPSSTPITPTVNTFVSRPASPETTRPNGIRPLSPEVCISLTLSFHEGRSGAPEKISDDRPPLPSGTVTPSALYAILSPSAANPKIRTLLLDVRTRAVFEFEHIRVRGQGSSGTICLEPSILLRDS